MRLRCPIKYVGASTVLLDFPTTRLAEVVTPERYGAKADGVTDDTVAIQAAMDSGVYRVSFSGATYVTGKLTPPTQIHLQGSHQMRTKLLLAAGTDDHMFDCDTSVWLNISDMRLSGNKANNAATSNGLDMNACVSCSIDRVRIDDFNDYGIYLDTCNDIAFNRVWSYQNQFGFYSTSGEQCNLEKCVIEDNETYGAKYVSALSGAVSTINGSWFENGTATPTDFVIVDSDNLHISANKFNVNDCINSAIRVLAGSRHNYILNNAFHQAGPTYSVVFDSGAYDNFSIANHGGSGGICGGGTTDNDGGNYVLEFDSTGAGFAKQAGRVYHHIITLADEATPSVKYGNYFITGGTVNDPITNFDDGENGQEIKIVARHGIQITHDVTKIMLLGGGNLTLVAGDTVVLFMDNGVWKQIGGTDNTA